MVYVVETDLECEFLTPREKTWPHQKLLLNGGSNNVGIIKSFSQIALGTIIY